MSLRVNETHLMVLYLQIFNSQNYTRLYKFLASGFFKILVSIFILSIKRSVFQKPFLFSIH